VRRGGQLSPHAREIYQRQALLYSWILRQLTGENVRAELILIEIGGDEVVREPLEADFEALDASVRRRLNSLIRAFDAEHAAIFSRRARRAAALSLPRHAPGSGADHRAAARALENREHLLLEAATGLGKTVAALYPALRTRSPTTSASSCSPPRPCSRTWLWRWSNSEPRRRLPRRAAARQGEDVRQREIICHEEYAASPGLLPQARHHRPAAPPAEEAPTLDPDVVYAAAKEAGLPVQVGLDRRAAPVVVAITTTPSTPRRAHRLRAEADL
jgi:hypothetical protein